MSESPPLPNDHSKRKRKKVSLACVYCRRSHMTCDEGRPCQRCIKRNIGNMCYDEPRGNAGRKKHHSKHNPATSAIHSSPRSVSPPSHHAVTPLPTPPNAIDTSHDDLDPSTFTLPQQQFHYEWKTATPALALTFNQSMGNELDILDNFLDDVSKKNEKERIREKFYLTAADPKDGKLEDRLNEVINAKYEAGFLKPYNYVNGYARLQRYMDQHMSPDSRQRILNVMGTFRPAFRDVAQSLTDVDLILVEESFERLLLDYDRVFTAMAIPACLWRRTGEIYKGNKEFATLIDVSVDDLRDGRMCIYEIMAEESTVNYWEKYGNIAFDAKQKAVLTSCLIRQQKKSTILSCCFSFTVRRDKFNIPTIIVGNFLPIDSAQ
ncbi:hypothetical protein DM01DRAFT_1209538 [Hesseltinella vesiculosa]|uniref:Zn(2)-C6 fungal-type domain-containing protein n=1 Tax=Hesseltinella vesiculosa TaxID=101127 RepID=A0A1X2GQB4_9FUNG|nr:hypothetical protein DM01DRAFT_1209538 [Hesseltinella vesiculosa]